MAQVGAVLSDRTLRREAHCWHGVFNMAELIAGHLLTRYNRANGQL
ncbi:hypothetical protein [Aquidulcibacter sp.]|nr:hypothetical protein [Aquidulcibacter sp.]MCA3696032.1 hypothetical protein [Aquidulcibacter sp.]